MSTKVISAATIKALFAKSGNCCAYPGCGAQLVDDRDQLVGQVCHIKAVKKKDARFDPEAGLDELHSKDNLILLCYPHHRRIDKYEAEFTVSALKQMREAHEEGVGGDFAVPDIVAADAQFLAISDEWVPDVSRALETISELLREAYVQPEMNRISSEVADLHDANMFIQVVLTANVLPAVERTALLEEQESWYIDRSRYAESKIESHGGSLAPVEYNLAYIEYTVNRIESLKARRQ